MMRSNDFDFIKDKFNNAEIEVPNSLNANNIEQKIKSKVNHKVIKFKNKNNGFKNFVTIAACFVLVLGLGAFVYNYEKADENTFKSYDDISAIVSETSLEEQGSGIFNSEEISFEEMQSYNDSIVDGDLVYYKYDNLISVYKTENGTATNIATLKNPFGNDFECEDIYVKDGILVAVGSQYENQKTKIKIFNVEDLQNPVQLYSYEQSGSYEGIYLENDNLYVYTMYSILDKENPIPNYTFNGKQEDIKAKNIYALGEEKYYYQYIVVTAMNIKTGKLTDKPKAILGGGYVKNKAKNKWYVADSDYQHKENFMQIEMKDGKALITKSSWNNTDLIENETTNQTSEGENYYFEDIIDVGNGYYIGFGLENVLDSGTEFAKLYVKENGTYKRLDSVDLSKYDYTSVATNCTEGILWNNGIVSFAKGRNKDYVLVFKAENDKLVVEKNIIKTFDMYIDKGVMVDDYFYLFQKTYDENDVTQVKVVSAKIK